MLRKIAFAAAVVTAWSVAQAANAGSGVPTGAQSHSPNAVAPLRSGSLIGTRSGDRPCRPAASFDQRQRGADAASEHEVGELR
jgi:hypothetical protein